MASFRGPSAPGWSSLTHFGNSTQSIAFYLWSPSAQPMRLPLVLWLHGGHYAPAAETIDRFPDGASLLQPATRYPCYVLQPMAQEGANFVGYYRSHPGPVFKLRPKIEESLRRAVYLLDMLLAARSSEIDPNRIVLAGGSMGAYGVWDLLVRFPRRFAGAFPIAGGGDPAHPNLRVLRERIARRELRIWSIHSAADRIVTPNASRNMFHALAADAPLETHHRHCKAADGLTALRCTESELAGKGWLAHTEYDAYWMKARGQRHPGGRGLPSHSQTFIIALSDRRLPEMLFSETPGEDSRVARVAS